MPIQKVVFPSFREQNYSQFEMRQLVSALELRFQALEQTEVDLFQTQSGDEFSLVGHTHVENEITDLQPYLININNESIFDLVDVTGTPNDNWVLVYNASINSFEVVAPGAAAAVSLDDLTDVNIPSPNDEDVLTFNSSSGFWEAQSQALVNTLFNLTDTDINGQNTFDLLFNATGTEWRHTAGNLVWNTNLNYLGLQNAHSINWNDGLGVSTELLILEGIVGSNEDISDSYEQDDTGLLSTTSTSFVDVDAANRAFDVSTLTDGDDYFLYCTTSFGNSISNAPTGNEVRLTEDAGSTTVTGSLGQIDESAGTVGFDWQFGYRKTAVSTSGNDVVLQYRQADGSFACESIDWNAFGINVSKFNTANYQYSEDTTGVTAGVYSTFVNTAASVTVGAGTWLVFVNAQFDGANSGLIHYVAINDGTTDIEIDSRDATSSTNSFCLGGIYIIDSFAGGTLTASVATQTTGAFCDRAMISAFKVDSFTDFNFTENLTQQTSFAGGDNTILSDSFTAAFTGTYAVIGYTLETWPGSGFSGNDRIEIDINTAGAVSRANNTAVQTETNTVQAGRPILPISTFPVTSGDTVDVDLIHDAAPSSGTNTIEACGMVVFAMETAGTTVEAFTVGDPNIRTDIDGELVSLKNDIGINWDDTSQNDIEMLTFEASTPGGEPLDDPNLGSVELLITAEAQADGATTITPDIGTDTFTATAGGGAPAAASVSDDFAKFGTKSVFTQDAGGLPNAFWSAAANNTDFDFGGGEFTIEMHILFRESVQNNVVISKWDQGTGDRSWHLSLDPTTLSSVRTTWIGSTDGAANDIDGVQKIISGTQAVDTWYHLAVVRDGDTMRYFWDGVEHGTDDVTGQSYFAADQPLMICGDTDAGAGQHTTYIDNLRITVGVARYTAGFTPPSVPFEGSSQDEIFIVGDPNFDTRIDGATTNITGDGDVDGDLNVDGAATITGATQITGALTVNGLTDLNADLEVTDSLTIFDVTETDSAVFTHDGTDLTTVFTTTGAWDISGLTGSVDFDLVNGIRIFDGSSSDFMRMSIGATTVLQLVPSGLTDMTIFGGIGLNVTDATGADAWRVSHDGTDANIALTNTTDLNWTGATGLYEFDNTVQVSETDAHVRVVGSGATGFFSRDTGAAADEGNWDIRNGTGNFEILLVDDAETGSNLALSLVRGTATAVNSWRVDTGVLGFGFFDAANVDAANFHHDGTDFRTVFDTFGTTADWRVVNLAGEMIFEDSGVRIEGSTAADFVSLSHDDTSLNMAFGSTARFNILDGVAVRIHDSTDVEYMALSQSLTAGIISNTVGDIELRPTGDVSLPAGNALTIYDSGDTDFGTFSHDGTDFLTAFTNTADWRVSGIGSIIVSSSVQMGEQSTNSSPAAGVAEYWVRDDVPNVPMFTDDAGTDYNLLEVTGGGTVSAPYRFSTTTTEADPGSGTFRMNNATPASVTEIYISTTTDNSNDWQNILGFISSGDQIYIQQDNDATRFVFFDVTANIDNTTWHSIEGTMNTSGTLFANNAKCHILILFGGSGAGVTTLAGLGDVDLTGQTTGDLLYNVDGTNWNDTAGNLSWDDNDNILTVDGDGIVVAGGGAIDYNDPTDAVNMTIGTSSTTVARINGTGALDFLDITNWNTAVRILDSTLRITDTAETDFGDFSHDGTDFNTAFTNTTDWNVTGISALSVVNYVFDVDQTVGAGQDNFVLTYDDALGTIQLEAAPGSQTPWTSDIDGAGFGLDNIDRLEIQDGGGTDTVTMTHDGTDFNVVAANTTGYDFSGTTNFFVDVSDRFLILEGTTAKFDFDHSGNYFWIHDGNALRISDAADTDFLEISHNGTSVLFNGTNTASYVFQDANVVVDDGNIFAIQDSTSTDFVNFQHNGTDLIVNDTNTGAMRLTTLNLSLADSLTMLFGTGDDVSIQYTGSNLEINNAGAGAMQFIGSPVHVRGGEAFAIFDSTNTDVLAFTNDGTNTVVTGTGTNMRFDNLDLYFDDAQGIEFGNSQDFSMGFNGTDMVFTSDVGSFDLSMVDLDLQMNDNDIIRAVMVDYAIESVTTVISSNAATLTYSDGPVFELDLDAATANVTITISGGPPSGTYGELSVRITQDSTDRTITWAGGSFLWPGGTQPTMSTGNDAEDIFFFQTWDGGTTWYGTAAQDFS